MRRVDLSCVVVLAAAACTSHPSGIERETAASGDESSPLARWALDVVANGTSFNGVNLNGHASNGVNLNGLALQGVKLAHERAAPFSLAVARLTVGDVLQADLTDGTSIPLEIERVRRADDLRWYEVSYPGSDGARPLCGLDVEGHPIEALALPGRWDLRAGVPEGGSWIDDPASFTFACRAATLAKCVELGYRPEATFEGIPLRPYHQACTRALRADYCGDGRSHTVDGTIVNLYDDLGVQPDTMDWPIEAEWTPSGAVRMPNPLYARHRLASDSAPACLEARGEVPLAAGDATGLIVTEYLDADSP